MLKSKSGKTNVKTAQIKKLRTQLLGTITDAKAVREHFATDNSVFTITPAAVAYPKTSQDVQEVVAYAASQATKKGKKATKLNVIGRGNGGDRSGGALGDGIMVVFPAHLNKLKRLTKDRVSVQPGQTFDALQQTLRTHDRCLPAVPAASHSATLGGVVSNNAGGARSYKYGSIANWVTGLKVVLDDGSIIETGRISRRELNRKKGLMTREGDIYRGIDGLLQDHQALIKQAQPATSKNAAGYRLGAIKRRDGSFDLSQLFIGAQGTLGLITEVTLKTAAYEPRTSLVAGYFGSLEQLGEAVLQLRKLRPSAIEMVDSHLLEFLRQHHPEIIADIVPDPLPRAMLLVEFDNPSHLRQNILTRRAARLMGKFASSHLATANPEEQERLWRVRGFASTALWLKNATGSPLPIIEDACVPVAKLPEFLADVHKLLRKHKLEAATWGHAGDANFYFQPLIDLSKAKGRTTVFKLMDEFYGLVIKLGGTISGEQGDGLLRAPYLEKQYGPDIYHIFREVKRICDPREIFNPRIKLGVTKKDLEPLLRHEYSPKQGYGHLPEM